MLDSLKLRSDERIIVCSETERPAGRDSPMSQPAEPHFDLPAALARSRRELLDLSGGNRLIHSSAKPGRARRIDILDERTEDVFRLLVVESRSLTFLPAKDAPTADQTPERPARAPDAEPEPEPEPDPERAVLPQPEEEASPAETDDPRYKDTQLQTGLASEKLQSRLLAMHYDAQTYEEEQGVSILYLACGFLNWYEAPGADAPKRSPLILVPVDLTRPSATGKFRLSLRDEELASNISLSARLEADFGIDLPEIEDDDDFTPSAYFARVREAIADRPKWEVAADEMTLGFFSFAKYLMYRDLDPENWPRHARLDANPTIKALLQRSFATIPPLCAGEEPLDSLLPPASRVHITDADGSQAIVIEETRRGRSLVVQGPPGTGKSQTITNIIAAAVKDGKKALFVAEKMAALQVVKSRLERAGLDAVCLELHSNKANKRAMISELGRTLRLGRPKRDESETLTALEKAIERLNRHAELMNSVIEPCGLTPFEVIGKLSGLSALSLPSPGPAPTEWRAWTRGDVDERTAGLAELETLLKGLGGWREHPWRGVRRKAAVTPGELREIVEKTGRLSASLDRLRTAGDTLVQTLREASAPGLSMAAIGDLSDWTRRLLEAPPMDPETAAQLVWDSRSDEIASLVDRGKTLAADRRRLEQELEPARWSAELEPIRDVLRRRGGTIFRFFHRDYRDAQRTFKGLFSPRKRTLAAQLAVLDAIIATRQGIVEFETAQAGASPVATALGADWKGLESNFEVIGRIVRWQRECRESGMPAALRALMPRTDRLESARPPLETINSERGPIRNQLEELRSALEIEATEAFDGDPSGIPLPRLIARLEEWRAQPEALSRMVAVRARMARLDDLGLRPVTLAVAEGRVAAGQVAAYFQLTYYEMLISDLLHQYGDLAEFDGGRHSAVVEAFRDRDVASCESARRETALAHFEAIPRGTGGEMGIVLHEIEKKRRHKPIRRLMKEAGTAIQAIKPVFLMSPISVAQFLPPGAVAFDLLVIDEASQVQPVDALGAMARTGQVVVVGDDRQLPPTRFFSRMLGEEGNDDDDDPGALADLESILGLCRAGGLPQRMLEWHYRSRHHSLIAVSNREFYDNRLLVIPNPEAVSEHEGLKFRFVADGSYDRGGSRANAREAEIVAQAVIEHARRFPGKSLGVGAFSMSQRDRIRGELERLLRSEPAVSSAEFFSPGKPEPFFIKNLENIQGDERDVIFISVGYARDKSGSLAMSFGPLSLEGGERRLNVLITRARERCEVYSSITADEINVERGRSRGAAALKSFLRYAETGLLGEGEPSSAGPENDFARRVAKVIEDHGFEVRHRVGTSGFVIDLAVFEPNAPGRAILGIQCDGPAYQRARWARDRDRLRDSLLRDRGWRLHRLWSPDWFHRPQEEIAKLLAAIEEARAAAALPAPAKESQPEPDPPPPAPGAEVEPEPSDPVVPVWIRDYEQAEFDVPRERAIHETSRSALKEVVARVVEIEGPIHRDEVVRRVTTLWGLTRTGNRIQESVQAAIELALSQGAIDDGDGFLTHPSQTSIPVRRRGEGVSPSLRKPEHLPPAEIREAALRLLEDHVGIRRDEIAPMIGKALGFKSTSGKLRETFDGVTDRMLGKGLIELRDEKLYRYKNMKDTQT